MNYFWNNLNISKNNIQILNTNQKAFATVALAGIKFLKTDFIEESTIVFNDFIGFIDYHFEFLDFQDLRDSHIDFCKFHGFHDSLMEL